MEEKERWSEANHWTARRCFVLGKTGCCRSSYQRLVTATRRTAIRGMKGCLNRSPTTTAWVASRKKNGLAMIRHGMYHSFYVWRSKSPCLLVVSCPLLTLRVINRVWKSEGRKGGCRTKHFGTYRGITRRVSWRMEAAV